MVELSIQNLWINPIGGGEILTSIPTQGKGWTKTKSDEPLHYKHTKRKKDGKSILILKSNYFRRVSGTAISIIELSKNQIGASQKLNSDKSATIVIPTNVHEIWRQKSVIVKAA